MGVWWFGDNSRSWALQDLTLRAENYHWNMRPYSQSTEGEEVGWAEKMHQICSVSHISPVSKLKSPAFQLEYLAWSSRAAVRQLQWWIFIPLLIGRYRLCMEMVNKSSRGGGEEKKLADVPGVGKTAHIEDNSVNFISVTHTPAFPHSHFLPSLELVQT